MLSTKPGKEAYVEPVIEGAPHGAPAHGAAASSRPADGTSAIPGYRFTVKVGKPKDAEAAKLGTTAGKRSAFRCLMSEAALTYDYIRAEGQSGRMGARLMAIVAEGSRGRIYLSPIPEQEAIARSAKPDWKPEMALPDNPRDFKTPNYGLTTFGDLFTDRQLVALTTFSDLVGEAREKVRHDALAAGLHDDGKPLRDGGLGATAYAEAIATFLAFGVDYAANYWSVIATPAEGFIRGTFARQALPMTWDYAEAPPFGDTSGNWMGGIEWIARACDLLPGAGFGVSCRLDAAVETLSSEKLISTDPPYYDNIGYADLSDLFYVWLRRSMRATFPGLFSTLAVPKAEELVATPYRHGGGRMPRDFS